MTKTLCVDASFIVRLLTSNDLNSTYDQIWQQWQQNKNILVAPTLLLYEVNNALHRYATATQIKPIEAQNLLAQAINFRISLYGDAEPGLFHSKL